MKSKAKYVRCPNCGLISEDKLKWYAETDADEGGVYVVYIGRCSHCYEELKEKFGYETTPDEPLRHET